MSYASTCVHPVLGTWVAKDQSPIPGTTLVRSEHPTLAEGSDRPPPYRPLPTPFAPFTISTLQVALEQSVDVGSRHTMTLEVARHRCLHDFCSQGAAAMRGRDVIFLWHSFFLSVPACVCRLSERAAAGLSGD